MYIFMYNVQKCSVIYTHLGSITAKKYKAKSTQRIGRERRDEYHFQIHG